MTTVMQLEQTRSTPEEPSFFVILLLLTGIIFFIMNLVFVSGLAGFLQLEFEEVRVDAGAARAAGQPPRSLLGFPQGPTSAAEKDRGEDELEGCAWPQRSVSKYAHC